VAEASDTPYMETLLEARKASAERKAQVRVCVRVKSFPCAFCEPESDDHLYVCHAHTVRHRLQVPVLRVDAAASRLLQRTQGHGTFAAAKEPVAHTHKVMGMAIKHHSI
jgi:hypothetical protein